MCVTCVQVPYGSQKRVFDNTLRLEYHAVVNTWEAEAVLSL